MAEKRHRRANRKKIRCIRQRKEIVRGLIWKEKREWRLIDCCLQLRKRLSLTLYNLISLAWNFTVLHNPEWQSNIFSNTWNICYSSTPVLPEILRHIPIFHPQRALIKAKQSRLDNHNFLSVTRNCSCNLLIYYRWLYKLF